MNIFILHESPITSAIFHTDRHIVKMPLETAQMLSTAQALNGIPSLYKPTHINHPCSIWVRSSLSNYLWTISLGIALCAEYQHRYNKIHGCKKVIDYCMEYIPKLPELGLTDFALAMPDQYKSTNAIQSYKDYYRNEKAHLFSWKNRDQNFILNYLNN